MRVEFNQGVPDGCIKWLWENVGPGNVKHSPIESSIRRERQEGDAWFYRRECVYPQGHEAVEGFNLASKYVPTITVKDPKLATWFVLRWSS
jgi:hypothetical protein